MPPRKKIVQEPPEKLTAAEARKKVAELQGKIDRIDKSARCIMCKKLKDIETKFYVNTNPIYGETTWTPICRECARKIALRIDEDGYEHEPTRESVALALRYLDKPFLENVWISSVNESENLTSAKVKTNVWTSYIKNIQMVQHVGKTYLDSDFFKNKKVLYNDEIKNITDVESNSEIIDTFKQNKNDCIRLLGYEPFKFENPSEQPYLYSNLIGYLDSADEANEDRMKLSSTIEIVKSFNHIEKINNMIAKLMDDVANIDSNVGTIKNLEETKSKITASVLKLAADNGISLKHSVNSSKGENTWTGKVRKLKDINLLEAETNLYDIEYSAGLQQVAEISNAALLKQLRLDENDYTDMIVQQKSLIDKYKKSSDDNEEKARLLLRENIDLKELLKEKKIKLDGDTYG